MTLSEAEKVSGRRRWVAPEVQEPINWYTLLLLYHNSYAEVKLYILNLLRVNKYNNKKENIEDEWHMEFKIL